MQIVYLSARPQLLSETLGHVRHFAPFLDNVVVIAPRRLEQQMASIGDPFEIAVTVVADEDLIDNPMRLDHAARNQQLRAAVVKHSAVADTFVMSDDDARPIVEIDESIFITPEGKHRRRYFHALADWRHNVTDFDKSLLHSWIVLRQRGFADPLCYASHMPQVIDKTIYAEVNDSLAAVSQTYTIDEWSPYFTIGPAEHPDRFGDPEPFVTLGWPQYPGEWAHQITPPQHVFENHHPELHDTGGLYDGLPTECIPETAAETNLEKIIRWYRLERQVRELDFPDDVDQPWTSDSQGRKLAFKGLRAARSAYRYVSLDDRARVAELEGRIRRLEQRPDQ